MILPSGDIRVYDTSLAESNSYFTGALNLQKLEFDPLVTGYAFIIWDKIPVWVQSYFPHFALMTQKNFKSFDGISDIELQTAAYNYGFANNEYNVATGITKGNTEFTLKHQEYSGNPIKNGYTWWVSGMYDPETGISPYAKYFGMDYAAKNHTGSLLYIMTRPDANNTDKRIIEFSAYYTNVFPTKIPIGHFNYSQDTHDLVEIEQPFKGTMHIGPKVDAYAKAKLASTYTIVTEGMFDPENGGNYAGQKLSDYNPAPIGISGSGRGEDIKTTPDGTSESV